MKCEKCGTDKECLGGRSAHRSNWYCPICPDWSGKTMNLQQLCLTGRTTVVSDNTMKTLEELIVHLERFVRNDQINDWLGFKIYLLEAKELLPGLKQAQSERQQLRELDGSVFVPSVTSDRTNACNHEYPEREGAIFDGMCPICSVKELKETQRKLGECSGSYAKLQKELEAARAEIADECAHYNQKVNELGEAREEIERLTQVLHTIMATGTRLSPNEYDEVK